MTPAIGYRLVVTKDALIHVSHVSASLAYTPCGRVVATAGTFSRNSEKGNFAPDGSVLSCVRCLGRFDAWRQEIAAYAVDIRGILSSNSVKTDEDVVI